MARHVIRTGDFAREAAEFILTKARAALAERGEFRIALSGGNTPRPVYAELAARELHWEQIIVSFGDERCLPPDDDASNYKMTYETLLEPAHVPAASVLRMRGELDPAVAADEYQQELDTLAATRGEPIYEHDLILLGLGEDGHTASLFPGTAALEETMRRVAANFVPKFNTWRLTFTFPLINHARQVCFLVDATKNAELIERVLEGDRQLPAARVNPPAGELTWILGE